MFVFKDPLKSKKPPKETQQVLPLVTVRQDLGVGL